MIIEPLHNARPVTLPADLGFGRTYTNRMFTQHYNNERGWHDAVIGAFKPLAVHPAAQVLQIGLDVFDGFKAYRRSDGHINLFRPDRNIARLNRSAQRLSMPQIDPQIHLEYIKALVKLEHKWVPRTPGSALYIRPVIIGSEPTLEVRAGSQFLHYVILSPVGPYFGDGLAPVSVHISHDFVRAVRGGTGDIKTACNYAGTVYVSEQVRQQGYQQVLWLDALERRYIEEVGAMNIVFVREGKHLCTPALSGSILPGVTRESILQLAPALGYTISEDKIDVHTMLADIDAGRITEVFGIGTGAVVAPVGKFGFMGKETVINNQQTGPVAQHIYSTLTDLQYGRIPDPYGLTQQILVE